MASNLAVPIQHMSAAPRNVALKTQSAPRRRARPNLKRNIIRSNNDYAVRVPSSTASSSAASSVSSHAAEPIRCQTCDCGADVFGCGADNDVWKEHLSSKEHLDVSYLALGNDVAPCSFKSYSPILLTHIRQCNALLF